jgi:hypothetical protein
MFDSDSEADFWLGSSLDKNSPEVIVQTKVHETFRSIQAYCGEQLNRSSIVDFNIACDALLDPKRDISPLLRHYDQLQNFCGIQLPSVKVMKLDQDFFRAFLTKMRKAQKTEIDIVKTNYEKSATYLVNQEFSRLQKLVKEEFLRFAEREEAQRQYSMRQQIEIER